jgi:PAS domain S-box-containing protein
MPDRDGPRDPVGILTVVLVYAAFASLWILLSDKATEWLLTDPAQFTLASTLKGLVFVAVTSLLLYGLMKRLLARPGGAELAPAGGLRPLVLPLALLTVAIVAMTAGVIAETIADVLWIALASLLFLFMAATGAFVFQQRQELAASLRQREIQSEKLRALQLLDAIAGGSADAIFAKDMEGRYLLFNREAARVTGKSSQEVLGRDDTVVFPPEQAARIMANDRQVMRENKAVTFQEDLTTTEGEISLLATKGPLHDGAGNVIGMFGISRDITERKRAEKERELTVDFLRLVNESSNEEEMIRAATAFFQERSGCEAVGIRLKEGDDYPYYVTRGFPAEFVLAESSLCSRGDMGEVIRDSTGYPVLACMCGNIIRGRFDSSKPFFTRNGSFWTSHTTELLATTTEADRQARTRNRCNGEGYESVALIPLRVGEDRLGLLQLNDRRKGRFSPVDIALWERLAGYLAVALAKFHAEGLRRESEQLYRSLFDNMLNGFAYCRMLFMEDQPQDFIYLAVNDAFTKLTRLKDVVGKKVTEVIPGIRESDSELFKIYGRVALSGNPEQFETYVGALRMWFSISVYSPKKEHFVAIFDVITERKQAEEALKRSLKEKVALLKEVHHRVKNNLQIVASLLSLQAGRTPNPEVVDVLHDTRNRVRSMALLHEVLYRSGNLARINFAAYVRELCAQMLRSSGPAAARVRVENHVAPIGLALEQAVPCGLIISELVSNSLKHGFPEDRSGRVVVELQPGDGQRLVLSVRDDGVGLPPDLDPAGTSTLGLKLVSNLAGQLGGQLVVERPHEGGATFRVVFPVPEDTPLGDES